MTRATPCLTISALGLLSCLLPAQVVTPAHFTNSEGNSYNNVPLGGTSATGYRYIQVMDELKTKAMTIRGFAIRRDSAVTDRPFMAYSMTISVTLSTAATDVSSISTTFDSNHGANKQQVLSNKTINFPAVRAGMAPNPFDYVINFDQPYAFNGNNGLCLDIQASNPTNILTTVYHDWVTGQSTNPAAAFAYYGDGCIHSTRYTPTSTTGRSSMNWPNKVGTLYLDGRELPTNSAVIAVFGISRTNLGAIPLPLQFPGSASQYSGACHLYTSLDFLFPAVSQSNGTVTSSFILPLDPAKANGVNIYGQLLAPDFQSGSLFPFVSTNGVEYNFVAPYTPVPGAYCYATNVFASTGSIAKNQMYVTQLR